MADLSHQKSARYRPEVDGLRAVAVLLLVLFHFKVPGFTGGFVGVDVFFVISGYLITQKLLAARERGRISFREFYAGRVRRLLPALYATLAGSALGAALLMSPTEIMSFSRSLLTALVSFSNVHFWSQAGYWDPSAETQPLLHTWSLGVEEQFYLLWPALIAVVLRASSLRSLWAVFWVVGIVSLLAAEWVVSWSPETAFYWMPFRGFEFCLGGLCVALDAGSWRERLQASPLTREALPTLGLSMIIGSALLFDEATPFPGVNALWPCVGAALVIMVRSVTVAPALLANRPAVFLGLLSYSFYLVHWPVLVFFQMAKRRPLEGVEVFPILAFSLFLAWLLFKFVETPLRESARFGAGNRAPSLMPVVRLASVPACVLALVAGGLLFSDGLRGWHSVERQEIDLAYGPAALARRRARRESLCPEFLSTTCGVDDPARGNVAVFGDSLAIDGLNALAAGFPERNLLLSTVPSCPAFVDLRGIASSKQCLKVNRQRWQLLESLQDVDAVVLWMRLDVKARSNMRQTVKFLAEGGHRVIVVGPGPEFTEPVPRIAFDHGSLLGLDEVAEAFALPNQEIIDATFAPLVAGLGQTYISQRGFFCPPGEPCRVVTKAGLGLAILDEIHLSLEGATELGLALREQYPDLLDGD